MTNDFILRLVKEHEELTDKFNKLEPFLNSATFYGLTAFEQSMLLCQYEHMRNYKHILERRIQFYRKA